MEFPTFRTEAARARFRRAYDDALAEWPVPHRSVELETHLGPTHVIASGPPDAAPVILLPSFSGTALLWAPNVTALSARHRVYAVDVIGQPGRSLARRRIETRDDLVRWLTEVMDGLGVPRATLIGSSFGAFLAMDLALAARDRVEKLVLIGPAGVFAKMSPAVVLRLLTSGLRRSLRRMLGDRRPAGAHVLFSPKVAPPPPGDAWRQLMDVVLEERPKVSLIAPAVFTSAELATLGVPALLLVGEHEQLGDAPALIARARALKPEIQAELVADADHLANVTAAKAVNDRMLRFLEG